RPARVTDAAVAWRALLAEGVVEVRELADGAHDVQLRALAERARSVEHRDARAVVAAIFQLAQPLDEDRRALPRSDVTNDAAHDLGGSLLLPPSCGRDRIEIWTDRCPKVQFCSLAATAPRRACRGNGRGRRAHSCR